MKYLDLALQDAEVQEDIRAAIDRVISSGTFILGPEGKALETEIAAYCGTKYAVGLNSGTDALKLALLAYGVRPGDEVITTLFTFVATAEMIAEIGARPVFVDIDPTTFNIDPAQIERAVTPRTRAIIPVHLYGLPAEIDGFSLGDSIVQNRSIAIIEDAAQAIGATHRGIRVGRLGDICCFSFFPAKNLGGYGDGGMVVTDNQDVADRIRMMRNHGSREKYHHEFLGVSSRLDEIQAAIIRAKLPILDRINGGKQAIATFYSEQLRDLTGILSVPRIPGDAAGIFQSSTSVFQQYTIRVERRDELKEHLRIRGIPTAIHYPMPLHLQPAFRYLGHKEGDFPEAEQASREVVSLPCYYRMPMADVECVIEGIRAFYDRG